MKSKLHGVENGVLMIMKLSSFLHFPLFSLGYFLKESENIFFVFLSSYRNTHESLGELEKYTVYDYMQLRRIAVTFLNMRLMYK